MATLIGVVSKVIGEVFAVASDGSRRELSEGDRVYAGEQLDTGAQGAVAVALANGGELTLGRDSSLELDTALLNGGSGNEVIVQDPVAPATPSQDDLTDVEQLQAAIEAGQDPTQAGEATAAGPGAGAGAGGPGGAGGGRSFVLLTEVGGAVAPNIGFPTEGLVRGPEFPDPDPAARNLPDPATPDGDPDAGSVAISLDEDSDLPGSLEGSPYGDDQPGVPASLSGNLGYNFGPDGPGAFSWNAVDLSNLSSHGQPLVAVISADGLTLVAHQGSVDGPVVFTATNTNPLTGAFDFNLELPLDHPVAGAEDTLNLNLDYTITDGNGTPSTGTLAVNVNDDSPELVSFEGEGEGNGDGPGLQLFPHVGGTVHEDALTQPGATDGPTLLALPTLPLNAPYEGNNEDGDPQGSDSNPAQTVNVSVESGPGSLTSLVNFGADGIGSFGLVGTAAATAVLDAQGLTSGGVALTYSVDVSADGSFTTLTASGPGYDVFTLQVGADGSFSFTLQGPLDHALANGDDGELFGNGDALGIDFTRLLTATDFDGDPVQGFGTANGLFTIDVEDDVPTIRAVGTEAQLQVDESDLGVNASANFSDAFTVQAGGDGLQSVNYQLTVSDPASGLVDTASGENVVLSVNAGVVEGRTEGSNELVFTVSVGADGTVTLDQIRPVVHDDASNPDDVDVLGSGHINLVATATDGDGDTATGSLDLGNAISFRDDGPSITPGTLAGIALVVDETFLSVDASADFSGAFTPVFGADGAGSVSYQLNVSVPGADSGLVDTASGDTIVLFKEGDTLVGRVGDAGGPISFTVTVNAATGVVTLDQQRAIVHDPDTGPNQTTGLLNDNLVQLTATVIDKDGDSATANLNIGGTLSFADDAPIIDPGTGLPPALVVDETNLNVDASADFSGAFTPLFGADGAGNVAYTLNVSAPGADTGLVDTASGDAIVLFKEGDLLVGRVGDAGGPISFTVSVNAATGVVTLDQQLAIAHLPDTGPDQASDSLLGNLIQLTGTITDGDGDTTSATVNIGGALSFEDDAPTVSPTTATATLDDEGLLGGINGGPGDVAGAATTTSGTLNFAAGADGLQSIALTGPSSLGTEAVTSVWDASTNTLTISSARGELVRVELTNPSTGAYTVSLLQPLMHPTAGTEDTLQLNVGYTVTDRDNDQASGNLTVNINDDSPTIQAADLGGSSFVTFTGSNAGYANSYGYYTKGPDGSPVDGKIIWANVHDQAPGDTADISGLDPSTTGFFIIPNGFNTNGGLVDGTAVTFSQVGGKWVASVGGTPLVGSDGANVLFNDASLNPGGSHLQDTGNAGNQNWEDLTNASDYDYDDVATNVTWGSSLQLQVDESDLGTNASANFSGTFNVQAGADGIASQTYNLGVTNANSGLVDTATGENVMLSVNASGVIEGRTSGTNDLVFTVSVNAGGTVTLDQIRAIVHPTGDADEAAYLGAGHISLGSTVVDGDGDSATATVDLGQVISFRDDGPSVGTNGTVLLDDDALPNGNAGGVNDDADSSNTSGTLAHNYGADGAGSIQWLTSGAPAGFSYETSGSNLLVKQGGTTVMTVSLNSSTGEYNVVQNAAIDHANADNENNQAFTFNYQVTDKDGDKANGTLQLNVDDDTPIAKNDVAQVQVAQGQSFNTMFVLDFSGSIDNSELNTMLTAVKAAAQALFNGTTGDVHAQIVAFSGDATSYLPVDNYADFAARIDSLNSNLPGGARPYSGSTDFSDAVQEVVNSFTPIAGASNQVFFISDGNPNESTGPGGEALSPAAAAQWNNFVSTNHINVTTIGIGDGISTGPLQQVDVDGNGVPILVDGFGSLIDTLVGQVTGGFVNGNVLNGSDGAVGGGDDDSFGADGAGRIQSIEVNGVTYTWDGANTIDPSSGANIVGNQLNNIATGQGGTLSFNFSTGAWSYTAPNTIAGDKVENFTYTIIDHDGDPSSASLTVYVEDASPIVARVDEDELAGGITDNDATTTIATGSVADLSAAGSGAQFSLSSNTSGLASATSHGVALVYSVAGDTLTATAGAGGPQVFTLQVAGNGDYTFTLKAPLDHAAGSGDDSLVTLNFASLLQATNGVNALPLAGDFLVQIENDIPVIAAGNAAPGSLQVDETNLAVNASQSFAGAFTGQFGADGAGSTTYGLNVSSAGVNSGLKDSATGNDIQLYKIGNDVVGKYGGAGGTTVFTVKVDASGVVTLDQVRAIAHTPDSGPDQAATLSAGNLVQLVATIIDHDGDSSSATLNLGNAISFKDDGPTVGTNAPVLLDDDALPNGNASGIGDDADSVNSSGTLAHSFGADGAGSIQWLTSGAPSGFSYETSGTSLLVKQGATTVLTVTLNSATGAYNVVQNAVINHTPGEAENNQPFNLSYQVTDKDGDKVTGSLSVNVDDDTPLAKGDIAYVQEAQGQNFNSVFVLDFSGSIDNSELNTMLTAVKTAAQALFSGTSGDVKAQIVAFSGDATAYPTFDNYADFAAKIDSLNSQIGGARPYSGSTDFSDAVTKVISSYTPIAGYSNQVFFISDGNPNESNGPGGASLTTAVASQWTNFVTSNHINVNTIGVGDGIDTVHLQEVDVDGSGSPVLVGNFAGLVDTLVAQVTGGLVNGNVLLGNNGAVGGGDDDSYGADGGGHIQSIQINGITYAWDGANTIDPSSGANISGNSLSNIVTAEGGKLSFNFSTGAYTYTAPTTVTGDKVESFQYTIIDHDGDPSSATLTVYVEDAAPVVGRVEEDELPGGVSDGDAFGTVATGNVGDLVFGPGTAQFSLSSNTSGLASATSHGVALVYSVVGNTLTATAGAAGPQVFTLQVQTDGSYTFTLKGPLDHPLANGDDTEALSLNFASILKAVDGSNNPMTLAGGFLVQIEDDVPTVALSGAQTPTLQVDDSNLAANATGNFANAFTVNHGGDGAGSTTYSLNVSSAGVASGLKDAASGSDILLYKEGNAIVGKVGGAGGATSFTLTVNASTGQVSLDQALALQHSPDTGPNQSTTLSAANLVQLVATVTDHDGDSASTALNLGNSLSFLDDAPTAANIVQNGQASTALNTNLMIVLDISGSMDNASGVGSMSRLDVAKNSLLELFEQYDALGDVKVSVVSFSTNATTEEVWVSIADAKAAILALQPADSTNFDAALIAAINAYGQPGKIAAGNVQNVAYFLSDGEPNVPSGDAGISNAAGSASGWPTPYSNGGVSEEQAWVNFLNANNVRSYALGMGTGSSVGGLDPIAYNGVTHSNTGGQVVSNLNNLTSVLVSTAQASPLSGNLTSGGSFGADGGYVRALTVDGKTFTYDKTANSVTATGGAPFTYSSGILTLGLASGGSLAVNVNSGAYTFSPPSVISTAIAASIVFTLIDLDGDTASAALNIAIDAGQAPMVVRDDLVLTNTDIQANADQISIPTWALLANDTGPSHNLLSIIAAGNAVDGSVNHTAGAQVFGEENASARDGGSFTYTASIDGHTALDTAVVTVDRAQAGETALDGTFRNEVLLGRETADTLNGNDGDDILLGLGGNDTLNGGEGNDILVGGLGNDALNGGNGVDTVSYHDATGSVTAILTATGGSSSGAAGADTFSNIENLIGSDYADTLTGNLNSNYIHGGAGNDIINGAAGDDVLVGGLGNDSLTGGTGNDTFVWEKGGLGGTDTINDFHVDLSGNSSDVLDLSQLLSGVAQAGNALDDYLSFNFGGGNTTIGISTTAGGPAQQSVVLSGVDLSSAAYYSSTDAATVINGMISDHALKTDTV